MIYVRWRLMQHMRAKPGSCTFVNGMKAVLGHGGVRVCLALMIAAQLTSCASQQVRPADPDSVEMQGHEDFADLHIVDCLLPGEVRRMGQSTFLSPRRPVRTTAIDCRIRGGEYTAYDRADHQTALNVWLEQARDGDPEAQYYVGTIYEKGMGRAPDHAAAFSWYERAAEQGFTKAQMALGYLYEMGLGVEQDLVESLKWYRRASGGGNEEIVFASAAQEKMNALRAELESDLERLKSEKRALAEQVERLRDEFQQRDDAGQASAETIATLERMLAQTERQTAETEGRLVRLRGQELPVIGSPEPTGYSERMTAEVERERFGKYHALVVGLESYMFWESLQSPHEDAREIADLLSSRYGFDTTLLLDASGAEILSAINDLRERVGSEDNVLLYFAGHGQLLRPETSELMRGYWLPVNAEVERTTYWISNSAINDYLAILDARSVLVIADSCFGGAMSTDPSTMMLGGDTAISERLIELGLSRKARFVLSSGGLRPVLDGTEGQHSIFARAFIEVLQASDGLMRVQDVFDRVARRTERLASAVGVEQRPELRPIREAGHEAGSFFFIADRPSGS
mgnify:CR=1 FL=1